MNRAILIAILTILTPALLNAHCDSLGGPVVNDARTALKNGRVDDVLKWVAAGDEAEVRSAFARALAVRTANDAARELADRWFFETVVRLHRASEGEPFTGLRPADWKPPAMLEAADAAVERGDTKELEPVLVRAVSTELRERFQRLLRAKAHAGESIEAGRAFVAAYTEFMRFVETFDHASTDGR